MKLSELSTDRAADVLCELAPYVGNITNDETVVNTIGKVIENGQELNRYGQVMMLMGRIGEFVPLLLKEHRPDVYGILSVMNERPVAEIAAQRLMETMRQVKELFKDEDFMAFFKSSARREQTVPSAPSANSPASE